MQGVGPGRLLAGDRGDAGNIGLRLAVACKKIIIEVPTSANLKNLHDLVGAINAKVDSHIDENNIPRTQNCTRYVGLLAG